MERCHSPSQEYPIREAQYRICEYSRLCIGHLELICEVYIQTDNVIPGGTSIVDALLSRLSMSPSADDAINVEELVKDVAAVSFEGR